MRYLPTLLAAAALAGWPALTLAQTADGPGKAPPSEAAPQTPSPSSAAAAEKSEAAPTGGAQNTNALASGLAVGQNVKDNTGAVIGSITDLKTDTDGKQVAVIKMGADAFSVEADRLSVQNGAAAINASQAQLKAMVHKH